MKTSRNMISKSGPQPSQAYDLNNLHPQDLIDRQFDDTSEGIDWDEILASTQDDFLAGRFAFNSADYATDEEAMAALERWIHNIFEEVLSETPAVPPCDASR